MRTLVGRALVLVALFVGAGALAACGDDADTAEPAESPGVEQGALDDIPRYPRSEPFGTQTEQDGIVTQSFQATGATPGEVIDFYVDALTELGWTEAEPAFRDDTSGRADFVDGDRRLEVSATTATDQVEGDPAGEVVQYSLTLRT